MPDTDSPLLVLDADNTIYDWVGIWARAFDAMTSVIAHQTGRDRDYWLDAFREVHIRRRSLECPAALEDLAADRCWAPFSGRESVLAQAAYAYRRVWDAQLAPYDGVRDALVRLASLGWQIVVYSESDAATTAARLTRMGLAGLIPRVFGRAPFSQPLRREWTLVQSPARLPITIDQVPRHDMKPNPAGLRDIVVRCNGSLAHTVYTGDNLAKDVLMAQRLGVRALWANYGTARRPEHAALLDRVAHWSAADVAEERAVTSQSAIPDAVLSDGASLFDAVAAVTVPIG
jgi:phosphoglycolate phosphatase